MNGVAPTVVHGLPEDVHRGANVGVARESGCTFLGAPVSSKSVRKVCLKLCQADASDTTTNGCGNDMASLDAPRLPGFSARPERAREHQFSGFLKSVIPPFTQHLGQRGIKRHPRIGVFGFHIADDAGHNRSPDEEHLTKYKNIRILALQMNGELKPIRGEFPYGRQVFRSGQTGNRPVSS